MYICKQYYKSVIISRDFQPKKGGRCLSLIHISEPTRPLYIAYAVFCWKKHRLYSVGAGPIEIG